MLPGKILILYVKLPYKKVRMLQKEKNMIFVDLSRAGHENLLKKELAF